MQPKLPFAQTLYECVNANCFYDGALMGYDDVRWQHHWSVSEQDLVLLATCPSCQEHMIPYEGDE